MILTALLSLTGVLSHRPPAEMIWAAQVFVGLAVGVKYGGVTWVELRRTVLAGLANGLLLGALSAAFIALIAGTGIAPRARGHPAGRSGEMVILAIIAGADLTMSCCITFCAWFWWCSARRW